MSTPTTSMTSGSVPTRNGVDAGKLSSLQKGEACVLKPVAEPVSLLPILKSRLPHSCFVYNQVLVYDEFKDDMQVFSVQVTERPEDVWIVTTYMREDWGHTISVSHPLTCSYPYSMPQGVQDALKHIPGIDWTQPFIFVAVDQRISEFFIMFLIRQLGNNIKIFPSYVFHMEPEDALKLDVTPRDDSVKLGSLDPVEGAKFLADHWAYTKPKTTEIFYRKSIAKHVSTGAYVNGGSTLASAAIMPAFGLLSALLTPPEFRRRGLATLVVKYMFKELAEKGFQPCLDAEISDTLAVTFHSSMNPRIIGRADYISHKAI